MSSQRSVRPALTVLECSAAIAILGLALTTVVQSAMWAVAERKRGDERQEAIEAVANVLEAARAQPWESLTPAWAGKQQLPPALVEQLREAKLLVKVEPEKNEMRRISVELTWKTGDGKPAKPIRMVSLVSRRSIQTGRGKS